MTITVYVTKDFGTIKDKNKFQRRLRSVYPNVHVLSRYAVGLKQEERDLIHNYYKALKTPRLLDPTPSQRLLNSILLGWYTFRTRLAEIIRPESRPVIATRSILRLDHIEDQRKVLEDLWEGVGEAKTPKPGMVLRIPEVLDVNG